MQEIKNTLKAIFEKLEQIDEKQAGMSSVQVRHEENLREHMRRTDLLEKEFKPVREHVLQMRGMGKVLMILIPLAGVIAAYMALR